jgi:hypothetical protein
MLILVNAVLIGVAAPARALPVIDYWDFLTLRNISSSLSSITAGDFALVVAQVSGASTPDPISSLSVQATQGMLTMPLDFNAHAYPATAPDAFYFALMPLATAETGIGWSITATDSTGTSLPVFAAPIGNPVLLPFVTGIAVSDTGTTPTVSWTLPSLTGFSVDLIRFRITDASTENWLLNTELPASSTNFLVPAGVLSPGGTYVYTVTLEDGGSSSQIIENESSAFSGVTRVPEPGALMLVLAALGLVLVGRAVRRWA